MRVVFMGSPEFSVPSLAALVTAHDVVGVVTQPDRPKGRGRKLVESAVKSWAKSHGLPVVQPVSVNRPEALVILEGWRPEVIVVAAFGQILRPGVLALPGRGCLNLHGSLLPRWRGASPIQSAILAGDSKTGISLMVIDEGMDTGPVLAQQAIPIRDDDTGGSLSARLAEVAAKLVIQELPAFEAGQLKPVAQDSALATHAPLLRKEAGRLDPATPAERLARQVRAFDPWPGSFVEWKGQRINIHKASAISEPQAAPQGTVVKGPDRLPAIQTCSGQLVLSLVQPAGRARMSGRDFINGAPDFIGDTLPAPSP